MKIESQKVIVDKNQQEMFDFLTNVENYEQLMPESKENFEVISPNTFLFSLKGMPEIQLKIEETREPDMVILSSASDKFNFSLDTNIEALNENQSEVQILFQGKFNAMMSMMVKSPLKKFIGNLTEKLQNL